jgi:TonB family protein
MKFAIALSLILLVGCAGELQTVTPTDTAEVVSMTSLPPLTTPSYRSQLKLTALFRTRADGTVMEVRLLTSSGDLPWDAAARDSMRLWRFAPARQDWSTPDRWIRCAVTVRVEPRIVMALGELTTTSEREADSLYSLLLAGVDFDTLAKRIRGGLSGPGGGADVDIAKFPLHVRNELRRLDVNGVTRPLRLGDTYVIYKRFDHDRSTGVPPGRDGRGSKDPSTQQNAFLCLRP